MEKWYYYVADESYLLWVIKMLIGAVLTPVWIILTTLGVEADFN